MTAEERFLIKSRPGAFDECWPWQGTMLSHGYGCLRWEGKYRRAHRVAYEYWVGDIPDGKMIHHRCGQKNCVNPLHLEPVTHKEHAARHPESHRENLRLAIEVGSAKKRAQTHCKYGHEFTPENTYWRTRKEGGRTCRICAARAAAEQWERRRAA